MGSLRVGQLGETRLVEGRDALGFGLVKVILVENKGLGEDVAQQAGKCGLAAGRAAADADDDGAWRLHFLALPSILYCHKLITEKEWCGEAMLRCLRMSKGHGNGSVEVSKSEWGGWTTRQCPYSALWRVYDRNKQYLCGSALCYAPEPRPTLLPIFLDQRVWCCGQYGD
jgi:hypothetical protein